MSGPTPSDPAVERAFARIPAPEALLAEEDLTRLAELDTDALRRLRGACESAEEGISYARRLLQGRLDILRATLNERDEPEAGRLLASLSTILADGGHVADPAQVRATRVRVPPHAADYTALVDDLVTEEELVSVDADGLDEVERMVSLLAAVEQELSQRRRALFRRIDALRGELMARYKDGRADVRELLA